MAALDLATSTPLTEGGRYIQWALYYALLFLGLGNIFWFGLNLERHRSLKNGGSEIKFSNKKFLK